MDVAGNEPVDVVAVKWYSTNAVAITFKNAVDSVAEQILYREDEARVEISDGSLSWSFDTDANRLRLVSETYRIHL
jgi:hypothetical protein